MIAVTLKTNPQKKEKYQTKTLEFEDARSLHALYGGKEHLLRKMEEVLEITMVTRDGWLRLHGSPRAIKQAEEIFKTLMQRQQPGFLIREEEFLEVLEQCSLKNTPPSPISLQCSLRKPPIIPKTESQRIYLRFMEEYAITFGIGPAGTGKTYLAIAKAVSDLKQGKISSIILSRPAVEAGEALGFLPGELQEKIFPYLRPLYDALHDMLEPEEIECYLEKNIIQIAPLAYMRGRTLNYAFIILDESQNTTKEQMFMFLTRMGMNSRCVITGDPTQIDLPRSKPSGLIEGLQALRSIRDIGFHYFQESDVVRHPLVKAIIQAYQQHRSLS